MQIKSLDNPKVAPDTITYNILLDGCVKCSMSDDQDSAVGLKHAEQALSWMEIEFQTGNKRIKPNYRSYSIVIQGFLNAGDTSKAEDWLDRMEERYVPTAKLFHSLIETCCRQVTNNDAALKGASLDVQEKQKQRQEALRAQRILIRMEELYRVTGTSNLLPDKALYDMVSQAWSDIGEDSLSTEQLENLRRSKDRLNDFLPNQSGDEQIESPSFTFTSPEQVIALLDNPDDREVSTLGFNKVLKQMADASVDSNTLAGQQAENILDFMIHLHSTGGADGQQLKPDIISFNTVVRAWAKTSHPQSAKRAEAVLQKLSKLHETGLLLDLQPDRITFNTIIHAYAKLGATNDADRVLRLLETMHRTTNEEKYQPDVVSYSTMLNAWANSNKQGAANHAEQVLLRMHEAHKANPGSCPAPNTECFNEVLYAWARSSEENAAKRSEMVMRLMEDMSKASGNDMVKPTTRSYNIVLYALAKSHDSDIDAPFRAQMILEKMKKAARSGELWMKPDHVSYTTVISAWCRLGGRQALDATERLVREACESRSAITVDDDFFANIIYSLARSGEKGAAQKAESIVNRMKTRSFANANKQFPVAPTTKVYNALLHCWAKSGERDAPARAEAILESMQDNFSKGVLTIKPDVQSFTSVLDALARSRDIHAWKRAESLIASMELTGRDDVSVRPNAHAYTSLIHNYARSRDLPQKAVRAQAVLNRMKESFEIEGNVAACPNIIAYNAVLNTCEYVPLSTTNSDERQEAFRVACAAWNEIRSSSYLKATHVTYASFLGVIAKLMPRSDIRNNMAELVFKRCCNDGQVAGIVLNKLKAAAPSHYNKVMNGLGSGSLPREWIFNVKQQ
jgi:pentatricopeptide repeat protein